MATKVEKKNRPAVMPAPQDEEQGSKFYDDDFLEQVAKVASAERGATESGQLVQPPVYPKYMERQQERTGAGRPKQKKKIPREKAMNVYFDQNTHELLKNMKFYHDIEMKDIPYLLTREFFKKYEIGGKLNEEGLLYIKRLLDEVN